MNDLQNASPLSLTLSLEQVDAAWPLLNSLPFPALFISRHYEILQLNTAGHQEYGNRQTSCYKLSHGYDSPCDENGESCPLRQAMTSAQSCSVLHTHQTAKGLQRHKVTAIPVSDIGVLELHIPLEDITSIDALSGLMNRTNGEQTARRSATLLRNLQRGYSLIMVDLDHFKHINDNHGHPIGDLVLKAAANQLSNTIRQTDIAIRWGGEEFLLMLADSDAAQAQLFCERLLAGIRGIIVEAPTGNIQITASIGVRTLTAAEALQLSFDRAISEADRALYEAKHKGRDCLAVFRSINHKNT